MKKSGKPHAHNGKWRIRHTDIYGQRVSRVFDSRLEAEIELRRLELQRAEAMRNPVKSQPSEPIKKEIPKPTPPPVQPKSDSSELSTQVLNELRELKESFGPKFPNKTFNELCNHWPERNKAERKRSHVDDESIIRAHLRPFFGNLKIRDINVLKVEQFKESKSHLSKKTVANHITLLVTMLNYAAANGWGITECPPIKKPKIIVADESFRFLKNETELSRFLIAAKDETEALPYYFYATAIFTGLRAGELAGLKRADIDLNANRITVRKSFDGETKSGRVRHVPILSVLKPVLTEWLNLNRSPDWLFPNAFGGPIGEGGRIFKQIFKRCLERAGFPKGYIRFHDLRHTFASSWVTNGGDLFTLQKILGHQTVTMTLRYAHLSPEAFEKDLSRLGETAPGLKRGNVIMPSFKK